MKVQRLFLTILSVALAMGCTARDLDHASHATRRHGPIRVEAAIDRLEAEIAEPFRLTISATAPNNVPLQFPEVADKFGPFRVVDVEDAFEIPAFGQRAWVRRMQLESYTAGFQSLPPVMIYSENVQGGIVVAESIASPQLKIHIRGASGLFADPTQPHPIEEVVGLNRGLAYWTIVATFLLAPLALAALAVRRWYTGRSADWAGLALRQLDELDTARLEERWATDRFVSEVYAVAQDYLRRRLSGSVFDESAQTARQRTPSVANAVGTAAERLRSLARLNDRVRYARYVPSLQEARQSSSDAREFLHSAATLDDGELLPLASQDLSQ